MTFKYFMDSKFYKTLVFNCRNKFLSTDGTKSSIKREHILSPISSDQITNQIFKPCSNSTYKINNTKHTTRPHKKNRFRTPAHDTSPNSHSQPMHRPYGSGIGLEVSNAPPDTLDPIPGRISRSHTKAGIESQNPHASGSNSPFCRKVVTQPGCTKSISPRG